MTIEDVDKYFSSCLEEYKTLRDESKQASINMISSMSIGIGIAAIAIVGGISFLTDPSMSLTPKNFFYPLSIFCLIVPFFIFIISAFWLGELARFKRAGNYICFIEAKISLMLNKFYITNIKEKWYNIQKEIEQRLKIEPTKSEIGRPMQWEIWLRSYEKDKFLATSGHMKWIYKLRAYLLIIAFYGVITYGIILFVRFYFIEYSYSIYHLPLSGNVLFFSMTIMAFIYGYIAIKIGKEIGIKQNPIYLEELFSLENKDVQDKK